MPPADGGFAALPAQPDLSPRDEGGKIDQAMLDVTQGQAQGIDPGDTGRHLIDQALHPESGEAEVVCDRGRSALAAAAPGEHLIAQTHELGTLVGQQPHDPVDLRDCGVGGIKVVELGHGRILVAWSPIIDPDLNLIDRWRVQMRRVFLWAARNQWLKEHLPRFQFMRKAVRRFMPGETLDDALAAAAPLQAAGIRTMYTRLGENLEDLAAADEVAAHYLEVIDRIVAAGIDGEVSVKPTQLGLDHDADTCLAHLVRIAEHAGAAGSYLWIDMEGSAYAEATISLYERLRAVQPKTGICLQAYLRRTAKDIERLRPLDPAIRLVKGAYEEKASIAYTERRAVDSNYVGLAVQFLLEGRGRPVQLGLGTHDVGLIEQIADQVGSAGIGKDAFEVEMLYGIRTDEQFRLAKAGYRVQALIAYGEHWYPWYMRRLAERPANVWFALRQLLP